MDIQVQSLGQTLETMEKQPSCADIHDLSVLKRCVPKTLAFAFGLRLRSKTQYFKTRVLGRGYLMENPKRGCDLGPCVLKR